MHANARLRAVLVLLTIVVLLPLRVQRRPPPVQGLGASQREMQDRVLNAPRRLEALRRLPCLGRCLSRRQCTPATA